MNRIESQHTEWKESWRDDLLRWVCGFANAEGGRLEIGRNDKGEIVGLANASKLLEDLPNKIRDLLGILVAVNLHHTDGKAWLVIEVDAYLNPISYRGHYYIRSGSTLQEIKGASLDRFLLHKQGRTWDGVPVPKVKAGDLSAQAIRKFREMAARSGRLDPADLRVSDAALIEKLKLTEGDYLKRAALLLFHEDPERFVTGAFVKIGYLLSDSGERVSYGPWLAAPRSKELFDHPKILMRRTDDHLRSGLDDSDSVCVNSCHVIKLKHSSDDDTHKYRSALAALNSPVCQWMFEADNPQMIGKTFAEIKVVYVERLPLPYSSAKQNRVLATLVDLVMNMKRWFIELPSRLTTRDPLMLAYWERVLNGLVYELYFPEDVHGADLHLFDLVEKAKLPDVNTLAENNRLPRLRQNFEELHDGAHPLRQALDQLQTLETVRIIEGKP